MVLVHLAPARRLFRSVLIADDHVVVAQGVRGLIAKASDAIDVVSSGEELLCYVRTTRPDVVIADLSMPGISGLDAMRQLHDEGHDPPFVFLTMHDEPSLAIAAVRSGARGYLPKTAAGEELVRALEDVVGGRVYVAADLSTRLIASMNRPAPRISQTQRRILEYVSLGLRNKAIAEEMALSVRTIESHKYAMMLELRVHTTLELLLRAKSEGLLGDRNPLIKPEPGWP